MQSQNQEHLNAIKKKALSFMYSIYQQHLYEIKCYTKPPPILTQVLLAVSHLMAGIYQGIDLDFEGFPLAKDYKGCKKMLVQAHNLVKECTKAVSEVGRDERLDRNIDYVRQKFPDLLKVNMEELKSINVATMAFCGWIQCMVQYKQVYYEITDSSFEKE